MRAKGRLAQALVAMVVVAGLGGCAAMGSRAGLTQSFDPGAAAIIKQEGKASISGQAFVRRSNGKLLRAVGTDVFLIPRNAYADERIAVLYGEGNTLRAGAKVPESDPLFEQYMRKTV